MIRWKEDGSGPTDGEVCSFHIIVQALDATPHTLRPVAAMQPRLDYFIVRPDTKDGRPGPIVPLVAADQLPDWLQLVGVARELDAKQTVGLTNLGIVEMEEDSTFEVCLHHDKIRAILSCADDTTDSYSSGNGTAKAKATEDERTTPICEPKIKTNEKAGSNESPAISSGHSNNAGPFIVDKTPQHGRSSERVLDASHHNLASFFQACGNNERPLRPHMTKAALDESRLTCPKHTAIKQDKQPVTAVCRHWCHHGTCKWGLQCRYVHRMPTTVEGLREVGLRDLPSWYLLMTSDAGNELPGLSSLDAMLRRLEDVQLSARQHKRLQQPQPYVDPGLLQGHTPTMLALDNPVSNKQKLKQIREMRHLILRGVHTTQGQRLPRRRDGIDHTNLCANARVAADAVHVRRQAERQQQTRDSMPVVPRARAAARSRVEHGRDSGDGGEGCILPARKDGRARNDCADVTNARSPGFVAGRAGSGEEKLVDID